jgi:hypothetical protein
MQFVASNGAYRRTRIVIDWLNVLIGVAVAIMAIVIFVFQGKYDGLFPVIFMLGTAMEGLGAAKSFLRYETVAGYVQVLLALALLFVTIISANMLWV